MPKRPVAKFSAAVAKHIADVLLDLGDGVTMDDIAAATGFTKAQISASFEAARSIAIEKMNGSAPEPVIAVSLTVPQARALLKYAAEGGRGLPAALAGRKVRLAAERAMYVLDRTIRAVEAGA